MSLRETVSQGLAEPPLRQEAAAGRAVPRLLLAGTVAALVGAGLLVWHSRGEAVYFDMLASALALCF